MNRRLMIALALLAAVVVGVAIGVAIRFGSETHDMELVVERDPDRQDCKALDQAELSRQPDRVIRALEDAYESGIGRATLTVDQAREILANWGDSACVTYRETNFHYLVYG